MRAAHDNRSLLLQVEVRDDIHHPGKPNTTMWQGDSIQIACCVNGKDLIEIGLTTAGNGTGWCWLHPTPNQRGKLKIPVQAQRRGSVTSYHIRLPWTFFNLKKVTSGTIIRLALAVNENDGRGRVRVMKLGDGITGVKDPEQFECLRLE
ncbi:MAG: hypothetical protein D6820_02750 [Lentisphaerae bacterium]|nr:MAG: hypothetical protein D6820_02750 [Lentisphaerota bacterium]